MKFCRIVGLCSILATMDPYTGAPDIEFIEKAEDEAQEHYEFMDLDPEDFDDMDNLTPKEEEDDREQPITRCGIGCD